ncbi:hypothetical protein CLAIMM_14046 isoform 1, partial [Cladophialophora immunda]
NLLSTCLDSSSLVIIPRTRARERERASERGLRHSPFPSEQIRSAIVLHYHLAISAIRLISVWVSVLPVPACSCDSRPLPPDYPRAHRPGDKVSEEIAPYNREIRERSSAASTQIGQIRWNRDQQGAKCRQIH